MPSDIMRIGEMLRKKREMIGLNLKECENSTSIRIRFLQAIEEGKIHQSISGIYAVGFLKQYASFLGCNLQDLTKEFPTAFISQSEKFDFAYGIGTIEMRKSSSGGVKWLPNLIWAIGIFLAIVITYYLAKAIGVV